MALCNLPLRAMGGNEVNEVKVINITMQKYGSVELQAPLNIYIVL